MNEGNKNVSINPKILNINTENIDLNNLIKHLDEVLSMKSIILKRFENHEEIKVCELKEEIIQRISIMRMCDDELVFQFMKLFFSFEKEIISKRNFDDNLEGFLSTLLINKSNKIS